MKSCGHSDLSYWFSKRKQIKIIHVYLVLSSTSQSHLKSDLLKSLLNNITLGSWLINVIVRLQKLYLFIFYFYYKYKQ